jgi:alpha-pyrone synthase
VTAPLLHGIGTAVPEISRPQMEIAEFMIDMHGLGPRDARRLRALYRRSRIDSRHTVVADFAGAPEDCTFLVPVSSGRTPPTTSDRMEVYRREAVRLAREACRDALARDGGMDPGAVDHLFVVTCTGFFAPGLDVLLTRELGLRADVGTTMVGFQGCQAGLTALGMADCYCRAHPQRAALVVCVELCTLHFQLEPTDENLLANAIFADGAAAGIVSGAARDVPGPGYRILEARSHLHGESLEEMVWTVTDRGFSLSLSSLIARILGANVPEILETAFAWTDGELRDSGLWAVHPGGAAILDALERSLGLDPRALRASREVLRRFGNMSSPTVLFVLRELLGEGGPDRRGLALAFGPGLKIEAVRLAREAR